MTMQEALEQIQEGLNDMVRIINEHIGTDWQEAAQRLKAYNAGLISAEELKAQLGLPDELDLPEPDVALPPLDWAPLREAMS